MTKRDKTRWCAIFGGTQKGGFQKGGFGGCSPGTKTGKRVRSDVPPERKTGTRVRSHVPPERKAERGYIRQNHPFTKAPFYLPVNFSWELNLLLDPQKLLGVIGGVMITLVTIAAELITYVIRDQFCNAKINYTTGKLIQNNDVM